MDEGSLPKMPVNYKYVKRR